MKKITLVSITAFLQIAGCSGEQFDNQRTSNNEQEAENLGGLTDFKMKHGIGTLGEPISLDEVDEDLAQKGEQIFESQQYKS